MRKVHVLVRPSLLWLALSLCGSRVYSASAPDYAWAVKAGGANGSDVETAGSAVAADPAGNIFVAGLMSGPSQFGTNLIGANGVSAVFLAKYNSAGEVQWAKTVHTGSRLECNAVVTDNVGGVYLAGAAELAYHGSGRSMFTRKYDANGNLIWTNSAGAIWTSYGIGPAGEAMGSALTLDGVGNLYVAGTFTGQPAFGSSNVLFLGIVRHAGGGVLLTNRAGNSASRPNDAFLAKYDRDGNFLWVTTAGGTNNDFAYGISAAGDGNVWLTGYFEREATFGNLRLNSTNDFLGPEAFVAKYDSGGTPLLALASVGGGERKVGCAVAGDQSGGAFLAGRFTAGTMSLGGLTVDNNLRTAGFAPYTDTFFARLNAAGNVVWLKLIDRQTGGYAVDSSAVGLVLDSSGNPVLTASYNDRPIFDAYQFASPPLPGLFVARYDTQGLFQWAVAADALRVSGQDWTTGSGTQRFVGNTLAADSLGSLYLTGTIQSSAGPVEFGSYSLTSHTDQFGNAGYDMFLTKLGSGGSPPAAPRLGLLRLRPGGAIELQVNGSVSSVVIERSGNLNDWQVLSTNSVVGGLVTFTDPLAGQAGGHYYRVFTRP